MTGTAEGELSPKQLLCTSSIRISETGAGETAARGLLSGFSDLHQTLFQLELEIKQYYNLYKQISNYITFICLVCACVCAYTHGVRGQLVGVVSLLPPCGSKDRTQIISFGTKRLYPLSCLSGPFFLFFLTSHSKFSRTSCPCNDSLAQMHTLLPKPSLSHQAFLVHIC